MNKFLEKTNCSDEVKRITQLTIELLQEDANETVEAEIVVDDATVTYIAMTTEAMIQAGMNSTVKIEEILADLVRSAFDLGHFYGRKSTEPLELPKQILVKSQNPAYKDQYYFPEIQVIRNWGIERMGDSEKRLDFPIGQWLWCIRFKQRPPGRYNLNTKDSLPNNYTRVEGVGETFEEAVTSVMADLIGIDWLDRSIVSKKHLEEHAERAKIEQEMRAKNI